MKCPEWDDLLQQRLDGGPPADPSALEHHLAGCPDCREWHAAAHRLEEGLRALPRPRPPAGLTERIVAQAIAGHRLRFRWQRRLLSLAAAACLMLAPAAAYLALGPAADSRAPLPGVSSPLVKASPMPPVVPPAAPSLRQSVEEAGSAVASLTDRIAGSTREQARLLWSATATVEVPMSSLPVVGELEPPLDLGTQSLREAGQGVSAGLQTVASSARRAVDYFFRELPALESGRKSLQ